MFNDKDQRSDDSRSTDQHLKPSHDVASDLDESLHFNHILVDNRLPECEGEEKHSYIDEEEWEAHTIHDSTQRTVSPGMTSMRYS